MNQRLLRILSGLACVFAIAGTSTAYGQNKALLFAGGNSSFSIPASTGSSPLNFTSDSFSIEAWILPRSFGSASGNDDYPILGNNYTSNRTGYVLRTGGNRRLSFAYGTSAGWQEIITPGPVLFQNRWHHIAVTKEGGNLKLYVDGQIVAAANFTPNSNISPATLTLAVGKATTYQLNSFEGLMDELKFWREARTQAQVQADGMEICGSFPPKLIAYYKLNDSGVTTNSPIVCANDTTFRAFGETNLTSDTGAYLFPGNTTELYVDSARTPAACGQAGYTWQTAFPELHSALVAAQLFPQIRKVYVARGTYYPRADHYQLMSNGSSIPTYSNYYRDKTFPIRGGLEVQGGYPGGGGPTPNYYLNRTILDGGRAAGVPTHKVGTVVHIGHTALPIDTTKLIGCTVKNNDGGLNIDCDGGNAIIKHCTITNDTDVYVGEGISSVYGNAGAMIIEDDTITHNNEAISLYDYDTVRIRNNYIAYNKVGGVYLYVPFVASISDNVFSHNPAGAINISRGYAEIRRNNIHHNGFGIRTDQVSGCIIDGNRVTDHPLGGMLLLGGINTVTNNVLMRDSAGFGAGIYCNNGDDTIRNNHLEANVASFSGGAIWSHEAGLECTGNQILYNSANQGGGMLIELGATIHNNIIVGNKSGSRASAIWAYLYNKSSVFGNLIAYNSSVSGPAVECNSYGTDTDRIINNTFYANESLSPPSSSTSNVAGLYLGSTSSALAVNNIFWKNKLGGSDTVQGADYSGSGATFRNNAMQLPFSKYTVGTGNFNLGASQQNNRFAVDPQFANPSRLAGIDGVFATHDDGLILAKGSPFIDTGNAYYVPATVTKDVRKGPRIYGSKIDLGAYELSCMPGNISPNGGMVICKGTGALLWVNTAAGAQDIRWYADSGSTAVLDTGYTYITPPLYNADTFWVAASGCFDSARIPIVVEVHKASFAVSGYTFAADTGAMAYQWMTCNPYSAIPGANSATYAATQNGAYTVAITKNGCTDTAACVTVTGLGIAGQHTSTDGLIIKPNPSSSIVHLSLTAPVDHATLLVINMQGSVIYKSPVETGKPLTLDLSSYPSGLYYFVVSDGTTRYAQPVMKQ